MKPGLIASMIFLPLDMVALAWSGMWLGMTSKGRGRAMVIGLFFVVALPPILASIWVALFSSLGGGELDVFRILILVCASLLIDVLLTIYAQARLIVDFRKMALMTHPR